MTRAFILAAALVAAAAPFTAGAPAAAQNQRLSGGFQDAVPERRMRPVPRGAAPMAVVSRNLPGFSQRAIDAFDRVPAIVVAPSGMVDAEKQEFSRTFRATPDGYFARLTGDDHDVIINGTLAYSVAPASVVVRRRTGPYNIQKSIGETDIAFSDFGGDYLVQFVCHEYSDQEGGCVTDEEAVAFYERFVPLGGGIP